ncbi:MAG: xylulokinase, partial [Anaerolineaceae bacterium]|nr:xylulokinase [Anaerolineaceae bacterium]
MTFFMGIDISTTATKALLIDEAGQVAAVASSEYSYETPHLLWSEQDPGLWWVAAVQSIQKVLAAAGIGGEDVKGIGMTGQMHGLVLLDSSAEVLRPAILWNDQRTARQCDDIRTRLGRDRLIQITGNDAVTSFTAPKILWVQQEEPQIYTQIAQILLPKDYIRYKLTDVYALDRAGGSGTLLFDIRKRTWSAEVLQALEIEPDWLPPTFEGTDVTGVVSGKAAEITGLKEGTPVMGGGGDQAAAAVGTGAVEGGIVSLSLGTSGVVFAATDHIVIEAGGRLDSFCHSVPGKWNLMGVMLSAAGSLRWHRDTFAPHMD